MDGRRVVRTGLDAAPRAHDRAGAVSLVTGAVDDGSVTVVLAAPRDESHDVGLRMLADRFALAGWRAHFLGAAVPTAELVAAVGARPGRRGPPVLVQGATPGPRRSVDAGTVR